LISPGDQADDLVVHQARRLATGETLPGRNIARKGQAWTNPGDVAFGLHVGRRAIYYSDILNSESAEGRD
jgi:hypothetical protein